jgi:50S ribosomal protein L16 3-hydroxylase
MTEPKYPDLDQQPEEPVSCENLRTYLESGGTLSRTEGARLAWRRSSNGCELFADGVRYTGSQAQESLFSGICNSGGLDLGDDTDLEQALELLTKLINQGIFYADAQD